MTAVLQLAQILASRLQALWGAAVEITDVRQLPGGASRESWGAVARTAGGAERRLILLRDPEGKESGRDNAAEAAAMVAARAAGVPAPELYDHGAEAFGPGQAYLLMERLDGETIPRRLLRDDAYAAVRPRLARRLGEVLARIHEVDPDCVPGLPRVDALSQAIGLYQDFAEPRPALEIGLRWLARHRPPPSAESLVHGDFRTGNLIVGEDGLRGVLDWELAHRGDPMQDLGWLCTKASRFGPAWWGGSSLATSRGPIRGWPFTPGSRQTPCASPNARPCSPPGTRATTRPGWPPSAARTMPSSARPSATGRWITASTTWSPRSAR